MLATLLSEDISKCYLRTKISMQWNNTGLHNHIHNSLTHKCTRARTTVDICTKANFRMVDQMAITNGKWQMA